MLLEYILLINLAGTINSNYGNNCAYVIKHSGTIQVFVNNMFS